MDEIYQKKSSKFKYENFYVYFIYQQIFVNKLCHESFIHGYFTNKNIN